MASRRTVLPAVVALAALLGACTPDLSPQSLVDKFRVLSIQVDPASGAPGQEVTARALMSDSAQGTAPSFVVWATCFPLPGQSGRQCMEGSANPDEPLSQWQFLGIEDTVNFSLPELDAEEEDKEIFLIFAACTGLPAFPDCECPGPDCESCLDQFDVFDVCVDGEDALAYKSVRVYQDPTMGNQNPQLVRVIRDGETWQEDDVPLVQCTEDACEKWTLGVEVTPESAQTYTVTRFDETLERTEEPYVSWFATDGSYDADRTGVGDEQENVAQVQWEPGTEQLTIKFYFVVYDGRGGVDWAVREANTI